MMGLGTRCDGSVPFWQQTIRPIADASMNSAFEAYKAAFTRECSSPEIVAYVCGNLKTELIKSAEKLAEAKEAATSSKSAFSPLSGKQRFEEDMLSAKSLAPFEWLHEVFAAAEHEAMATFETPAKAADTPSSLHPVDSTGAESAARDMRAMYERLAARGEVLRRTQQGAGVSR